MLWGGEGIIIEDLVQFAQKVVKAVTGIVPFQISLSDEAGYIIGSTNPTRIGTLHTPSKEVLEKDTFILFDEEKVKRLDNVLPGIAVPLKFDYKTVGVLGIIGPPEQVEPYAKLVKKYVEMMWQDTFHKQIKDLEAKTLESVAQYILLNQSLHKERVEQYCKMLHISYAQKRFCIVIDIGDFLLNSVHNNIPVDQLKERLLDCTSRAFAVHHDGICTFLNTEKIILLKPVQNEAEYIAALNHFTDQSLTLMDMFSSYKITNISVAAGNWCTLERASQSYQEAERLIKSGEKLAISPKIYTFYNWDILLELLPMEINTDFQDKIIFRLRALMENDRYTELTNAFTAYCDNNMNISKAAKALFIHRNTLIYRLKKLETITSLDMRRFEHCTILYLLMKNIG